MPKGSPRSPQAALVATGMKRCNACREIKPLESFHKSANAAGGRTDRCKVCARHNLRKNYFHRVYNISLDDYDALFKKQKGVCAICKLPPRTVGRDGKTLTPLHVDHDHENGAVRALLCHSCNTAIGHFNHDVALLQAAIEYLRQPWLF